LAWAGHADAAGTIAEGWAQKDRAKTNGALSDALIDEIAFIGSEDEVHARIREDAQGGVHTQIVAPLPGSLDDIKRTFAAFTADSFSFSGA
jgi:alkanesulfonate monooxygenase SsuD/methylene tetrahydromethanopterin reductase-like flavin-dependent oxidoreductase (luciferase family)